MLSRFGGEVVLVGWGCGSELRFVVQRGGVDGPDLKLGLNVPSSLMFQ